MTSRSQPHDLDMKHDTCNIIVMTDYGGRSIFSVAAQEDLDNLPRDHA